MLKRSTTCTFYSGNMFPADTLGFFVKNLACWKFVPSNVDLA